MQLWYPSLNNKSTKFCCMRGNAGGHWMQKHQYQVIKRNEEWRAWGWNFCWPWPWTLMPIPSITGVTMHPFAQESLACEHFPVLNMRDTHSRVLIWLVIWCIMTIFNSSSSIRKLGVCIWRLGPLAEVAWTPEEVRIAALGGDWLSCDTGPHSDLTAFCCNMKLSFECPFCSLSLGGSLWFLSFWGSRNLAVSLIILFQIAF